MEATAFESIGKMQRIINQVNFSPALVALASMQSSIAQQQFNQVNGMNEILLGVAKNTFQQIERINLPFASIEFQKQMENRNWLREKVLQSAKIVNLQLGEAMSALGSPTITPQFGKRFWKINNPALMQIAKTVEAYSSLAIKMQFGNIQALSKTTFLAVSQAAKAFDLTDIEFSANGAIMHDGVEYSYEAIEEELNVQLQEAEGNPTSLKQTADKLRKKFWLLIIIVQLMLFFPQLPETMNFYGGIISQVYKASYNETTTCYIVKETAFMREEASTKSKIVGKLAYDTTLEVLDTIPRWLNVKYTDEAGKEQRGWISKISVEMEEPHSDK